MSAPLGPDNINTTGWPFLNSAHGHGDSSIADASVRDQDAVVARFKEKFVGAPGSGISVFTGGSGPLSQVFSGVSGGLPGTLSALVNKLFGTSTSFPRIGDALAAIEEVPVLGHIAEWLTGVSGGSGSDISTWASNIKSMFGGGDLASGSLDINEAWSGIITTILNPLGLIESVLDSITKGNLDGLFGGIDVSSGSLDVTAAWSSVIEDIFNPLGLIESILPDGFLSGLFDSFTGSTGSTGKSVSDVIAAAAAQFSVIGSKLPTSLFNSAAVSGSNLVLSPDFEDISVLRPASNGGYSTEQAHGGVSSWRLQGSGSGERDLLLSPVSSASFFDWDTAAFRVNAGDTYYVEAWVKGKSTNSGGGSFAMRNGFYSSGAGTDTWPDFDTAANTANTAGGTGWVKLAGYVTVPSGFDRWFPYVLTTSGVPATDYVYVDDVVVREVTESQSIISVLFGGSVVGSTVLDTAIPTLSQSKITSLTADLGGIGLIRDGLFNKLTGLTGSGWLQSDTDQAVADTQAVIAANSAAIAAMKTVGTGSGNSGKNVVVDFSTRSNAGSLGADFTQTYSGSGTSVLGVLNGRAALNPAVADAPRTCLYTYNVEPTDTDYQIIGLSMASAPGSGTDSGENHIHGRKNSAGTTYVFAEMERNVARLGCVVSGTRTVGATKSSGFRFKSTATYFLVCGTTGGLRQYQLWENTTLVLTWLDAGSVSQAGASYRYVGGGIYVYSAGAWVDGPGEVISFMFADNTPPTYPGSGARMYRTGTGTVNMSSGRNLLPTNFYDANEYTSPDITADLVNGEFTVANAGLYDITVCHKISLGIVGGTRVAPVLYRQGGAYLVGNDAMNAIYTLASTNVNPRWIAHTWTGVPLTAGQSVQAGYDGSASLSNVFSGESSGAEAYFSISHSPPRVSVT